MATERQANRWADFEVVLTCYSLAGGSLRRDAAICGSEILQALAFPPSGEYLLSSHRNGISIYRVPTLRRCYNLDWANSGAAFSADGRYVALEDTRQHPARVGARREPAARDGPSGDPAGPASHTQGGVDTMQEICLVELRTQRECWRVSSGHTLYNPAVSSDGGLIAFRVSEDRPSPVDVWDTRRNKRLARLGAYTEYRFLPNSDILLLLEYHPPNLTIYRARSGTRLGAIEHPGIGSYSLSSDGRSFAVSEGSNSIGIWDLNRARLGRLGVRGRGSPAAARRPSQAELSGWYEAIAGSDAVAARQGIAGLGESGDWGVEFLEARLKPETLEKAEVLRLVRELDSDDFRARQSALTKLEGVATIAKRWLREQLEASESAEVRASLRRALAVADNYCIRDPERIRCLRAIECLEIIASPRARRLLVRLAGGSPSSAITQDASAAIVRMDEWVTAE